MPGVACTAPLAFSGIRLILFLRPFPTARGVKYAFSLGMKNFPRSGPRSTFSTIYGVIGTYSHNMTKFFCARNEFKIANPRCDY